jgi:hypothetical protein
MTGVFLQLVFAVLFTVGSSAPAHAWLVQPQAYAKWLARCPSSAAAQDCHTLVEQSLKKTGQGKHFSRSGTSLRVHLKSGTWRLKDQLKSGSNAVRYRYITYLDVLQVHVMHAQFSDGEAFVLMDHLTGKTELTYGFPELSSDGLRFASFAHGAESSTDPTLVQIWRREKDGLALEFSYETDPDEWGAKQLTWVNDQQIRAQGICKNNVSVECAARDLVFEAGAWVVKAQ